MESKLQPARKKPRTDDLRFFENPFLKQSSCNDPERADGKVTMNFVAASCHSLLRICVLSYPQSWWASYSKL